MSTLIAAVAGLLVMGGYMVEAQPLTYPLTYDIHYVLPEAAGTGGVDIGFLTPDIDKIDEFGDIDIMAKYALADWFEVGARATLGVLRDDAKALSSITLGAKYSLGSRTAATANLSAKRETDNYGISAGLMHSMLVGDIGVNSHILFGFLDGYTPNGTLIDVMIQPVLPLSDRVFAYLDILLTSDSQELVDRSSVILVPNLDYEIIPGLMLNGGIRFSIHSGDDIRHDTKVGVILSLLMSTPLR